MIADVGGGTHRNTRTGTTLTMRKVTQTRISQRFNRFMRGALLRLFGVGALTDEWNRIA
jgi:hypothetical protein